MSLIKCGQQPPKTTVQSIQFSSFCLETEENKSSRVFSKMTFKTSIEMTRSHAGKNTKVRCYIDKDGDIYIFDPVPPQVLYSLYENHERLYSHFMNMSSCQGAVINAGNGLEPAKCATVPSDIPSGNQ